MAEGGRIRTAGTVAPQSPSVEAQLEVADLALAPFQPYVDAGAHGQPHVRRLFAEGRAAPRGQGRRRADDLPGRVQARRPAAGGNRRAATPWSAGSRVQTDQLTLELEPNRLEIGDLKVVRPVGKFIIAKDRSINLVKVVKVDTGAKKVAAPPAEPFPYRVRRVLVSEGKVDFADLSLITPFGTRIHELKGVVAGVSSVRNTRAQVKLDGRVDDYGTAKIDGELNTSDPKAFTNISVAFRNVEMSRLTPYSGEFAGRKIESGKLTVDLKYKIDRSQLAGDNRLVVERLTLGEKVAEPGGRRPAAGPGRRAAVGLQRRDRPRPAGQRRSRFA